MNQTYISLDIETTGLNPDADEIIEIGAVKFQGEQVIDTFYSLVNPQRNLSYRIQLLCGITQAELETAPSFSELSGKLISFLDTNALVGHNIPFDLGFLAKKGITLSNDTYDTYELATLLLFQLSDYSLSSLTKHLCLAQPKHRALVDATATKELFVALLKRAYHLDIPTLEELVRLAHKADWQLGSLFREILRSKTKTAFSESHKRQVKKGDEKALRTESDKPLTPRAEKIPINLDNLSGILESNGLFSKAFPGYEHRPEQVRMAHAIAEALNNSEHLIVEAGTGTGKSVAYLLPSIIFATQNSTPVVISTNTINLQEQLISKDIPDLIRALDVEQNPSIKKSLKAVQVKGRSNYLCLRKYESLRARDRLSLDEAKLLARIKVWLLSTQTGDRAELNLGGNELSTWSKLCAEFEERLEAQCPHKQHGTCFLYQARQAAASAHLIVVNHALLLSDMVADNKILPPYTHLIIDEAHHLEEAATRQLGYEITQWDLFNHFNLFRQEISGQRSTGLLAWLDDCFRGSNVALSRQRQVRELADSLSDNVDKARNCVSQFFNRLRDFVEGHANDQGDYDRTLRLTASTRAQPEWSRVEIACEHFNEVLTAISNDLDRLYTSLEDLAENKVSGYDYLMLELSSLLYQNKELCQRIDSLIAHPDADSIYWLNIDSQTNAIGIYSAPLNVGRLLEKLLFSTKDCIVLTGATLSTEGTFEYIKNRIGLEYPQELLLGSPFNYLNAAMIYIANDIPEPGNPGYQQAVERALLDLCRACKGRTLVLFTSYSALRATQAAIQPSLESEGILVLGQGVDGSPKQLLATFKSNPNTVLLGTASLWEGIDVVGEALSVLAITRLPFNVPTEPIFSARAELFDDPFNQYAIPQATIRFKQGFGRLIRSKTDRGAVVILDRRIQTKRYGSAFLDSIPLCTVVKGPSRDLPAAISGWLKQAQKNIDSPACRKK
jgi:DNA polymerase-3 subunit epsilon/ATP-dependent DNA helicase DinG